jgi:hypothetical protein
METITTAQHPKFVRWALMLGIVIILNIFFNVVLTLFYPAPDYNAYCPAQPTVSPTDAATCDAQGGVWTEDPNAPTPAEMNGTTKPIETGYCDMTAKCQPLYDAAESQHELYGFVIMVGLGLLSLIAGFMPLGSSIVSSGLSYGGVVALIFASARYWSDAGSWIQLAISVIGLIALIFIGVRRFRD